MLVLTAKVSPNIATMYVPMHEPLTEATNSFHSAPLRFIPLQHPLPLPLVYLDLSWSKIWYRASSILYRDIWISGDEM